MKVRLLNPSIYADPEYSKLHPKETSPRDPGSYPIVVEGFFDACDLEFKEKYGFEIESVKVFADELNRVFKSYHFDGSPMIDSGYSRDAALGWWNHEGKPKAWEPVGPFDFWNKLKESREVGETVGKGYL